MYENPDTAPISRVNGQAFSVFLRNGKLFRMYSSAVLDHFKNPRNAGDLQDATAVVEVSNPVCGDVLRLSAHVETGSIAECRFKAQGCVTALACASILTEMLTAKPLDLAKRITATQISEALGGLAPATFHGAQLAADALAALLAKLSS